MTIFVIWCVTALACAYLISLIRRVPPATLPWLLRRTCPATSGAILFPDRAQ